MQETSHYQLAQWDGADRILREVFNRDNARIDAALAEAAAEAAAERAAREALERRVGAAKLLTVSVPAASNNVTLTLSNIAWEQWRTVYAIVTGSTAMSLYANGSANALLGGVQEFPASLLFFPLYNKSLRVSGLCFGETGPNPFLIANTSFANLSSIQLLCNSAKQIKAGTSLTFWGVK